MSFTKMLSRRSKLFILLHLLTLCSVDGKKHRLKVEEDDRKTIDLTTFGFFRGGFIQVNITAFSTSFEKLEAVDNNFGFTLSKLVSSGMSSLENKGNTCLLRPSDRQLAENNIAIITFSMDFTSKIVHVTRRGNDVQNITLSTKPVEAFDLVYRRKRSLDMRDSYLIPASRQKRQAKSTDNETKPGIRVTLPAQPVQGQPTNPVPQQQMIPNSDNPKTKSDTLNMLSSTLPVLSENAENQHSSLNKSETVVETITQKPVVPQKTSQSIYVNDGYIKNSFPLSVDEQGKYTFMFVAYFNEKEEEGQYEFDYHNCRSLEEDTKTKVNFTAFLIEKNDQNYLSAGHIPLPMIYATLSVVFFFMAFVWLYVLRKSKEQVYKLHYLMLVLMYTKALALLFHAINYHFMAKRGHHEEAVAIIYYITYLMRGILLFVTIILIGAGWAFVKYILSDRDKKIFIIIIPLQVLANVAQIIIEETEEGESQFITWNEILIIVDLLCCGAILFPVVWSIRHLQEASQTDGKAAVNLLKLKLFRHFYIMIVCYIYFTRIIVYLLRIAVPFEYEWLDELFRELATLVFYVVTGYKFRPATDNPYLQVPQESDDEVEMDEVVTQSGALEGLTKVNVKFSSGNGDSTTTASKRESSHDYD